MNNSLARLQGFAWRALNTEWMIYAPWTTYEQLRGEAFWQTYAVKTVESFEQIASRFRKGSELRLWMDHDPEHAQVVSPILHQLLKDALFYQKQTDGLFNFHLGNDLIHAGYDQSFEIIRLRNENKSPYQYVDRSIPSNSNAVTVVECVSDEKRIWKRPRQTTLDFGGIGKGWIVDHLAERLQKQWQLPCGIIDAGGDLRVWSNDSSMSIPIEIANPFNVHQSIIEIPLRNGAIATSSKLQRRWKDRTGNWNHHLLDPRTKLPSESKVVQASVVTNHATEADVLAKCICLLDPTDSATFLTRFQQIEQAWIVMEDRSVYQWSRTQKGASTWKTFSTC